MSQIRLSFFGKLANITDAAVSVCIRFLRKCCRRRKTIAVCCCDDDFLRQAARRHEVKIIG